MDTKDVRIVTGLPTSEDCKLNNLQSFVIMGQ